MLRIHHLEVACYLLFFGKDPGVCDHIRSKVGACYLVSLFCKKDCKETGSTAHIQLGNSLMQECEDIKRQLPISSYLRPAWDVEELGKNDMEQISIDLGLSKRVYKERDEFYNPTPMFAIAARKQSNS